MTTAETIKELRNSKGLSREELANAAGLSAITIRKIEEGSRFLSEQSAAAIAKATGTTFSIVFQ